MKTFQSISSFGMIFGPVWVGSDLNMGKFLLWIMWLGYVVNENSKVIKEYW